MKNFYYIIGEEQSTVIEEDKQVADFAEQNMGAIHSDELSRIIANVFGKGDYFPGPDGVLTSIIHEFVRRKKTIEETEPPACFIISALRLLNGNIDVDQIATIGMELQQLSPDRIGDFYTLLLHSLPTIQQKLTQKAYAPDSKLVAIIKDAAEYHQRQKQ